jgi:predicted ATPase
MKEPVPAAQLSDGMIMVLAYLAVLYSPKPPRLLLVEEPENGIHPRAVETMYQSLSSVYEAQILTATHSQIILSVAAAKDVLCFAKNEIGATDIVSGDHHPNLKDWQGQENLGTLFAAGVLG